MFRPSEMRLFVRKVHQANPRLFEIIGNVDYPSGSQLDIVHQTCEEVKDLHERTGGNTNLPISEYKLRTERTATDWEDKLLGGY